MSTSSTLPRALSMHPRLPAPGWRQALATRWPTIAFFIGIGVIWEVVIRLSHTPAYILPRPSAILLRLLRDWPYFAGEAGVTLAEALAGLLLASIVALSTALLMARFRWAERTLFPLAVAVKVTPMVVVAPLLVLWLGFGPTPKIIVAALLSFFPILSNAMIGFRAVNPRTLEFLRSLNASQWEILRELRVRHALPYLFSAYKVSVTLSVIGAVVAEWVGADRGLGHVVILANAKLDMTTLIAAVMILALLGIALFLVVEAIERRLLFWHESVLTTERYE